MSYYLRVFAAGFLCSFIVWLIQILIRDIWILFKLWSDRRRCDGCNKRFADKQLAPASGDEWYCRKCWDRIAQHESRNERLVNSMIRQTHTYVTLNVSESAYNEIASELRDAGYDHAFGDDGEIDMHGIALTKETPAPAPAVPVEDLIE